MYKNNQSEIILEKLHFWLVWTILAEFPKWSDQMFDSWFAHSSFLQVTISSSSLLDEESRIFFSESQILGKSSFSVEENTFEDPAMLILEIGTLWLQSSCRSWRTSPVSIPSLKLRSRSDKLPKLYRLALSELTPFESSLLETKK